MEHIKWLPRPPKIWQKIEYMYVFQSYIILSQMYVTFRHALDMYTR